MAFVDRVDSRGDGGNLINLENDGDVAMETDEECSSNHGEKEGNNSMQEEAEEGELIDQDEGLEEPVFNETRPLERPKFPLTAPGTPSIKGNFAPAGIEKRFGNRAGGFVTGVDIFSPEEQEKLTKRAQRFGLDPNEAKPLTHKKLKQLYKSMGVREGDENIRFDTLHMKGTEEMNSQDVFNYFKDYAPASIEWLSTSSCNVMWLDEISAARALLGLSKRIRNLESGLPKTISRSNDSDSDEAMEESIQKRNGGDVASEDSDGGVSISEVVVGTEIPPGLWRKGASHPLAECILLRFATRQDRRVNNASRFNSHEFAGYVGLISESRKRKLQESIGGGVVFYDTGDEVYQKQASGDPSNPWASIAYSWGAFDRNKNKRLGQDSPPKRPTPPPSPVLMTSRHPMRRRGAGDDSGGGSDEDTRGGGRGGKMPRMRMHADDLEERLKARSLEKRRHKLERHGSLSDLRKRLRKEASMLIVKRECSESPEDEEEEEEEEELPDLRVAVAASPPRSRSASPEDRKEDIVLKPVKSVLRGARGHVSDEEESPRGDRKRGGRGQVSDEEETRGDRKHRSRSKERHHRRHRKHKETTQRRGDRSKERTSRTSPDYDSDEVCAQPNAKDLRAKIKKRSSHDRERQSRDKERHSRDIDHKRGDRESRDRNHRSRDRRSPFRPKSPLRIEIDNDEYYRLIESD
ncbi:nuclear cap-binding protein subunit 3 [Nilaparvata lugens]|uniref:nuclear cap-binding protein subunit 3 n=1 Tax=Nilaparvata lugens TaxID=108931 RepID=UPI00193D8752|nr:nuclear cap-binding protein subunit 3 [Nilaparvata lugens]